MVKIFVAGATGVLARTLIPGLVERGHQVVGMIRRPSQRELVERLGATTAEADALDAPAVIRAVTEAEPEVVVHELTALSRPTGLRDARNPGRSNAMLQTNRLRQAGTDNLLSAAHQAGARRVVAQSFAAYRWVPSGGPLLTEEVPFDLASPAQPRSAIAALVHLEEAVTSIDWGIGVVLRYGALYGPGTIVSREPDALLAKALRRRQFPIIGGGAGVFSHVHIDDAASATIAAIEGGAVGVYNIVDDEPAAVADWVPALATALGAGPPRHLPRWLGRLLAGSTATAMMTDVCGASNAKAKRELDWTLKYPTWRVGFTRGLG